MKFGRSSWEYLLTGAFVSVILLATAAAEGRSPDSPESQNRSAAEVGKQDANPLSDIWLMQFEQNHNWIGMPQKQGDRVQSHLAE